MSIPARWRFGVLIIAAVALAGYRWGPELYHNTIPQTAAWVQYAGGQWRDVRLADGSTVHLVSVLGDDPTDVLLVADVDPMDGAAYYARAEAIALAVRDSALRAGTFKFDVMLMIGDQDRWPWQDRVMRGYQWQSGGDPATWKLVTYIGPAADRPAELSARYAAARARS
ncbi:MAG TPA: hypothetical protein VG940_03215 [Gemmatimonadales bacterium]|nr:hypothetical protein [Gemmatimonadales bacterium]